MQPTYDALFAGLAIILVALVTVFAPFPELGRLFVMLLLCLAAYATHRLLYVKPQ